MRSPSIWPALRAGEVMRVQWQYTSYVWVYVASALVMGLLIALLWRRRTTVGVPALLVLCLAVIPYTLGNALEIGSTTEQSATFWCQVQYFGIVVIPLAWFLFAAQYGGQIAHFRRLHLAILAFIPALTLILVWTNGLHGLVWWNVLLDSAGAYSVLVKNYGPWFWINMLYSYVLITMGAGFLIQSAVHSPRLYRAQATALILGATVPVLANVGYIAGALRLQPALDLAGPSFAVSAVIVAGDILCFRLFDIVPARRHAVIENMNDGVLVLDRLDRVVDLNPAAAGIIGGSVSDAIGRPISSVLSGYSSAMEGSRDLSEADVTVSVPAAQGESSQHYEMRVSPIKDARGQVTARLIMIRDITEREQTEQKLEYLSTHDALTGVFNRSYFEAEMERLQPSRRFPVAIVVADINGLKDCNDTLGHAAGDDLLRRAAVVLRSAFRAEDMIARIGGDEFVVLLPDAGEQAGAAALRRIKRSLQVHNEIHSPPPLSMAVGVATAGVGDQLVDALRQADRRMYADKDSAVV